MGSEKLRNIGSPPMSQREKLCCPGYFPVLGSTWDNPTWKVDPCSIRCKNLIGRNIYKVYLRSLTGSPMVHGTTGINLLYGSSEQVSSNFPLVVSGG